VYNKKLGSDSFSIGIEHVSLCILGKVPDISRYIKINLKNRLF